MKEKIYDVNKQFSLHQWYSKSGETGVQQDSIEKGFDRAGLRSDDFPNVDIVSTLIQ